MFREVEIVAGKNAGYQGERNNVPRYPAATRDRLRALTERDAAGVRTVPASVLRA